MLKLIVDTDEYDLKHNEYGIVTDLINELEFGEYSKLRIYGNNFGHYEISEGTVEFRKYRTTFVYPHNKLVGISNEHISSYELIKEE